MADTPSNFNAPAPLVALAAWILPGAGYLLIGQRSRGWTIGLTVLALFFGGLLIGGVRVLDVPGYGPDGQRTMVYIRSAGQQVPLWAMEASPWAEIQKKPWSIAQILAGPLAIISGKASLWAATPNPAYVDPDGRPASPALTSHTPVNEAGTLYTSVAGMLNLMAIIDATYRATRRHEQEDA